LLARSPKLHLKTRLNNIKITCHCSTAAINIGKTFSSFNHSVVVVFENIALLAVAPMKVEIEGFEPLAGILGVAEGSGIGLM
jgi:hypothetical protein